MEESGFLPPRAPGGQEPAQWEARPKDGEGHARMVVATASTAPQLVQAGEHPPRNGQAVASISVGLAGVALLVVSLGVSFVVSLPCAVIALALGRQGRRRAETEGIGGWRAARAGVTLGIIGILLCLLAAVAWILIIALDLDVRTDVGRGGPFAEILLRHL